MENDDPNRVLTDPIEIATLAARVAAQESNKFFRPYTDFAFIMAGVAREVAQQENFRSFSQAIHNLLADCGLDENGALLKTEK